jgi:hypothetical protein
MASKTVPPSVDLKAFNCPRCGALADQEWFEAMALAQPDRPFVIDADILAKIKSHSPEVKEQDAHKRYVEMAERAVTGEIFLTKESNQYGSPLKNVFVSKCRSCGDLTLWRYDRILYPPTQYEIEPNEDLADEIKADFNEARAILDLSPRGAAALLRLCIQKLCKQLGQPGKHINSDIAALVKAGLAPKVQKALDFVRVIGNEAVHPGSIDLKDDRGTAAKLFVLVNRIAYDMITHPRELDALYDSLPEAKKDEIAKRDAKAKASA